MFHVTEMCTAWKVSKYRDFSCQYFPVFGLNTEIQSEYKNIHTQKKLRIWILFTQR